MAVEGVSSAISGSVPFRLRCPKIYSMLGLILIIRSRSSLGFHAGKLNAFPCEPENMLVSGAWDGFCEEIGQVLG